MHSVPAAANSASMRQTAWSMPCSVSLQAVTKAVDGRHARGKAAEAASTCRNGFGRAGRPFEMRKFDATASPLATTGSSSGMKKAGRAAHVPGRPAGRPRQTEIGRRAAR